MAKLKFAVGVFLVVFLVGCAGATFTRDAYRSLTTAATTYETAMNAARDLDMRGMLNENLKFQIREVATKYHYAYHKAAECVVIYEETKDAGQKQQYLTFSKQATALLADLLVLVQEANDGQ